MKRNLENTIIVIILVFFCLVLYFNSLGNAFIFDDIHTIVQNQYIKNPGYLGLFFKGLYSSEPVPQGMLRPLLMLTFVFNYLFSGLNPLGYHIINLLLHFLNGILFYSLLRFLKKDLPFGLSLGVSLLFIAHPINNEAVIYITCRSDLLVTLFVLSAFLLYGMGKYKAFSSPLQIAESHRRRRFSWGIGKYIMSPKELAGSSGRRPVSGQFLSFAYEIKPWVVELVDSEPKRTPEGRSAYLVFVGLNYRGVDYLKDIDTLIQKLKETQPFDEFVGNIGFYYINLSQEEENLFFKNTRGFPPLNVRSDFLGDILVKLKSGYKLVIVDAQGSVSCAELSSKGKMSLIVLGKKRYKDEDSFAKGFLHELGHSLGLRDECVDCEKLCPSGPPNCAATKEEAQEWWGDLVGRVSRVNYISGCCGDKRFIRPTIASLMNDPDKAEDFGPVNEQYLRNILEALRGK